jgi:hypothetical protein
MITLLCWHRPRLSRGHAFCRHCSVAIEQCPCVSWRVEDGKCELCLGSGWLSTVRGEVAKFREYAGIDGPRPSGGASMS